MRKLMVGLLLCGSAYAQDTTINYKEMVDFDAGLDKWYQMTSKKN